MLPYNNTDRPLYNPKNPFVWTVFFTQSPIPLYFLAPPVIANEIDDQFVFHGFGAIIDHFYHSKAIEVPKRNKTPNWSLENSHSPFSSNCNCVFTYSVGNVMQISIPPVIPPVNEQKKYIENSMSKWIKSLCELTSNDSFQSSWSASGCCGSIIFHPWSLWKGASSRNWQQIWAVWVHFCRELFCICQICLFLVTKIWNGPKFQEL